jgi:hypothetical protein
MQRSSPSIGTLASALAKAQGELVNPEKSLVATIRGGGPRGAGQTFHFAPLSSGLDIVRKVLGRHEIATAQTTSIDQTAGIINLTTVLAHARDAARQRGICPAIPYRSNTKDARLLSETTLQGTGTHRTSGRQAQTLQAYRTSMREDGAELRLVRRACSRLHLDQIRPHGLILPRIGQIV